MKKLTLLAGAALLGWASVGSAQAQTVYVGGGWNSGYYRHHNGWNNGGAVAAGLVGGALLGGLISSAATPAYSYPAYGYPAYGYRTTTYPAYSDPAYGYRTTYPAYGYGYGNGYDGSPYYRAPAATRVVYQAAPVYQSRVVYRQPRVRSRIVYRAAPVYQPRTVTRVVYRQDRPARLVRNAVRRDVVTTGSIRNNGYRVRIQSR